MPWDIFPVEKLGITQVSHEYHPSIIIKVPNDFQKKGYRPKPPPNTGLHAPVCSAGSTCLLTTANAAHALQCSRRQRARRPREPGRGGQRREEPSALPLELLQHAPEEGTQSELLRKTRKFQPTTTEPQLFVVATEYKAPGTEPMRAFAGTENQYLMQSSLLGVTTSGSNRAQVALGVGHNTCQGRHTRMNPWTTPSKPLVCVPSSGACWRCSYTEQEWASDVCRVPVLWFRSARIPYQVVSVCNFSFFRFQRLFSDSIQRGACTGGVMLGFD